MGIKRHERTLELDKLGGHIVSTVRMPDAFSYNFETMVFKDGDWGELDCDRYSTEAEARDGHASMVAKWREKLGVSS